MGEAVRHAAAHVHDIYLTPEAADRHADILARARAAGLYTHTVTPRVMAAMSADAQGVLAVVATTALAAGPQPQEDGTEAGATGEDAAERSDTEPAGSAERPGARSADAEAAGAESAGEGLAGRLAGARLVAVLAEAQDPGNAGTIIRTADAAGADAVVVGKASAELYSPKVMRSAAGSHFHVPCVAGIEASELAARAREAGLQVLTAEGTGEWELPVLVREAAEAKILGAAPSGPDLRRRALWFVGNEARGFAGYDFDADARVAVPLYGKAESLNVSTALAVCAYASAMAQRAD